jgi:hypothetical protein
MKASAEKALVRMEYRAGKSALYMMDLTDFRIGTVQVLGRGQYDRRAKTLTVGDTRYAVFPDYSVREA